MNTIEILQGLLSKSYTSVFLSDIPASVYDFLS